LARQVRPADVSAESRSKLLRCQLRLEQQACCPHARCAFASARPNRRHVAATAEDIDQYLVAHPAAVKNPLHDMGFPSIGCYTCTNPTDRGDVAALDLDDAYAPFFG
jgi:hypothetical protein